LTLLFSSSWLILFIHKPSNSAVSLTPPSNTENMMKKSIEPAQNFTSRITPAIRSLLNRAPGCEELFSNQFFLNCGNLTLLGPSGEEQKEVMGHYFPKTGVPLPASVAYPDVLDLRFQSPGSSESPLEQKWTQIASRKCGLIVGPSGSGKVCLLLF
jgi:hypothetical protein